MTSTFKTDLGNGVTIHADDYVGSGSWIFDCRYSRLISRTPLSIPVVELETAEKITFGNMYTLSEADEKNAKLAIQTIIATPDWYKSLRYLYSSLNESSRLNAHLFDLLANHDGRQWALRVRQSLDRQGKSSFKISAQPYDPETYVDYLKAMRMASGSCAVPQ